MNQPHIPGDAGPETAVTTQTPRRRRFWLTGIVAGTLAVGTLGACSHHRGGWHGGGEGDAAGRIEHVVNKVFSRVDATDDQKARITAIATEAFKDLSPMKGQMRESRGKALELLTAESLDRNAIESLRSAQLANFDRATSRASTALADIAEVLTPAQRAQIREKVAARMDKHKHKHRRGWWHGS